MRHLKARQREDGTWDYTETWRGRARPIGNCPADAKTGHHATEEEARECYRQYLLDGLHEKEYTSAHKCRVCGEFTPRALALGGYLSQSFFLCDEHRTREHVEQLFPPGSVGESWQS